MSVHVILVEPQQGCNVGFIARAMKNFGFQNLTLIGPGFKYEEARTTAMHANEVVEGARVLRSFSEIKELDIDYLVGTTGIAASEGNFLRRAIAPRDLVKLAASDRIGLVFGKESSGLSNRELDQCDFVVRIPTTERYPIMNLSHAAAIVLYEFSQNSNSKGDSISNEKAQLEKLFKTMISKLDYSEKERRNLKRIVRNWIGRSFLFRKEAHILIGFFNKVRESIKSE